MNIENDAFLSHAYHTVTLVLCMYIGMAIGKHFSVIKEIFDDFVVYGTSKKLNVTCAQKVPLV